MKWILLIFCASGLAAQTPAAAAEAQTPAQKEQADLSNAMAEAGSSGTDLTRALEHHLAKYPDSHQRAAIEKALAQWAIELNDRRRTILYGERVLKAEPNNELLLIDRVIRALLDSKDAESAKRALVYAKRYEAQVDAMRSRSSEGHVSEGEWAKQVDRNKARALVLEARATGDIGNLEEAAAIAKKAWGLAPGEEDARETATWLAKLGRKAEAVQFYANAFAVPDASAGSADRTLDRAKAGELYVSLNGSEKGLGDLLLHAFDEAEAARRASVAAIRMKDPNFEVTDVAGFTLPRLNGGESLPLASLKGKTIVMDFWATWCGPCVAQHPLIESVKKKFEKDSNIVFLSVNSDDDHSLVDPFVKDKHWNGPVYFDGGLGRLLKITSIPTLLVLDKDGHISSRMTGYVPELFEEMLQQRIEEARSN